METTWKYLRYLENVVSAIEISGLEEKYRVEAFRLAAAPMHY